MAKRKRRPRGRNDITKKAKITKADIEDAHRAFKRRDAKAFPLLDGLLDATVDEDSETS